MGIVSSTFASLTIQFAWNCQRLLDPQYRCVEDKMVCEISPPPVTPTVVPAVGSTSVKNKALAVGPNVVGSNVNNNNNTHQENRNRRAAQLRLNRRRPSSFDTAFIASRREFGASSIHPSGVVTATPSPLRCPARARLWDVTSSSSGCSSDSASDLDSDSETELRVSEPAILEKSEKERPEEEEGFSMSPAEEAAFRLTVGRGHFSRSKKDRFLNHLRLEKRLNDLNNDAFGAVYRKYGCTLRRRHSGDLRRIV